MPIDDPYRVLGVSQSATQEDITKAYRQLAKKFHPDLNPGDKAAEQKMREINAAYEQIKSGQHGGASYERTDGSYGPTPEHNSQQTYSGSYGGFGGFEDFFNGFGGYDEFFGGQRQSQPGYNQSELRQVIQLVQLGQYQQAIQLLAQITNRGAAWYYYSAISNWNIGNRVTGLSHAQEAARMEPNNQHFISLLQQMQRGSYTYQQTGERHGYNMNDLGSTIMKLLLAQMFCMCCCRGCVCC